MRFCDFHRMLKFMKEACGILLFVHFHEFSAEKCNFLVCFFQFLRSLAAMMKQVDRIREVDEDCVDLRILDDFWVGQEKGGFMKQEDHVVQCLPLWSVVFQGGRWVVNFGRDFETGLKAITVFKRGFAFSAERKRLATFLDEGEHHGLYDAMEHRMEMIGHMSFNEVEVR